MSQLQSQNSVIWTLCGSYDIECMGEQKISKKVLKIESRSKYNCSREIVACEKSPEKS